MNDYQENFIYTDNYGNAQIDWLRYEMAYQKITKKVKSDYCLRHQMSKCTECKHE